MLYEPTSTDAWRVYAAAATHHGVLPNTVDQPNQGVVKRTSLGAFRIMPSERQDVNSRLPEDLAICMYDKHTEFWYVRLQDGAIVKVAGNEAGQLVVVTD
jgi:hypothetical protein